VNTTGQELQNFEISLMSFSKAEKDRGWT